MTRAREGKQSAGVPNREIQVDRSTENSRRLTGSDQQEEAAKNQEKTLSSGGLSSIDISEVRLKILQRIVNVPDEELLDQIREVSSNDSEIQRIGNAGKSISSTAVQDAAQEIDAHSEHQTAFRQVVERLQRLGKCLPPAHMLMVGTTWVYAAAAVVTTAVDPATIPEVNNQVGIIGAALGATAAGAALHKATKARHYLHNDAAQMTDQMSPSDGGDICRPYQHRCDRDGVPAADPARHRSGRGGHGPDLRA